MCVWGEMFVLFKKKLPVKNAIKRRSDFHGVELVALTDQWNGIEIGNLENAIYDPIRDRYEVTNLVTGAFYNILKNLEKSLNFTTKLYKRKDGRWGLPQIHQNGSVEMSPGMVSDLMYGSADLIVTGLTILYERQYVIDFLQPIFPEEGGIFIKTQSLENEFDFEAFVKPLEKLTWFTILGSYLITSFFIVVIQICGQQDLSIFNSPLNFSKIK
jgi:hypothetical protein